MCFVWFVFFFFFKQKTAYEMRISDWSSDVCSSDLPDRETDDVTALGFQTLGVIGNHHDRAGLCAAHALGKLGHFSPRFGAVGNADSTIHWRGSMAGRTRSCDGNVLV